MVNYMEKWLRLENATLLVLIKKEKERKIKMKIIKCLVYIPKSQISELLSTIFKEKLLKTINKISQNRENLLYDSRIRNLINFFDKYRERKANERENELREIPSEEKLKKSSDVDIYYKSTFPLCMYEIQKHINKYSHLMHFGRLQYTLFLNTLFLL